jgi:hypothetical protein
VTVDKDMERPEPYQEPPLDLPDPDNPEHESWSDKTNEDDDREASAGDVRSGIA